MSTQLTADTSKRGSRIKGARTLEDDTIRSRVRADTHMHAKLRVHRGHPANSLMQACPIIGVGIRVSMHA